MNKQALKKRVIDTIDARAKEIIDPFASLGPQKEYTEYTNILFN